MEDNACTGFAKMFAQVFRKSLCKNSNILANAIIASIH